VTLPVKEAWEAAAQAPSRSRVLSRLQRLHRPTGGCIGRLAAASADRRLHRPTRSDLVRQPGSWTSLSHAWEKKKCCV
jgi:hypothetical protein